MMSWRPVVALVFLTAAIAGSSADLRVGAFNIQIFGRTKAAKPDVMAALVKIIRRYDILLIQEIRDSSGSAIKKLLAAVNENQPVASQFSMTVSPRLGRTNSKEQYAYFYRGKGLQFVDSFVYNDVNDEFEREPMVALFRYNGFDFALVGIHIDPDKVPKELNALDAVVKSVRGNMVDSVMILGDLNADCSYMPQYKWKKLGLRNNKRDYAWLIGDGVDTTIKNTHCAYDRRIYVWLKGDDIVTIIIDTKPVYDRFIASGDKWKTVIVSGSIQVYRFDQDFGLTLDQASLVSDHFPIEFTLRVGFRTERLSGVYIYLTDPTQSLDKNTFFTVTKSLSKLQMDVFDGTENVGVIRNEAVNLRLFDFYRKPGVTIKIKPVSNRYRGRQKADVYVTYPV